MRPNWLGGAACLLVLATAMGPARAEGAWTERVQVVYEPDTRSVVRRPVRVWDAEPRKNLEFVWEPAAGQADGGLAADGTVNGRGKLIWRVRGSANYDPAATYSTYTGELKDGRPHGRGRLEFRTGEMLEGTFADGLLEGEGTHRTAAGDRFEGTFVRGRLEGSGRHLARSGEIFAGTFRDGLRHGQGEVRTAGGAVVATTWSMGRQTGGPASVADGTVGGMLKAQTGGGDADRVEIGIVVEPKMTQQTADEGGMTYQHYVQEQDIAVFPVDEDMNNAWNGTGEVNADAMYFMESMDFSYAPAFLEVDLRTSDGKRAKLEDLGLEVVSSQAYRKPMLSVVEHLGCVGFRPAFSLKNFGWGEAKDMTLNVSFSGPGTTSPTSRVFTRSVGSFDEGIDVAIRDVFEEAGADTTQLDGARYQCQDADSRAVCTSRAFNDLRLGEVASHVWNDEDYARVTAEEAGETWEQPEPGEYPPPGQYFTTARGTLDYSWTDDLGNTYQASEAFSAKIPVVYIEYGLQAECGAPFGASPEALRFQDVRLPLGKENYRVDMPVRGSKSISKYVARLKVQAEPNITSFHQFRVSARFADGSVKESKPVSLYYFLPREPTFQAGLMPPPEACYVPLGATGCSEIDPRYATEGGEEGEAQ